MLLFIFFNRSARPNNFTSDRQGWRHSSGSRHCHVLQSHEPSRSSVCQPAFSHRRPVRLRLPTQAVDGNLRRTPDPSRLSAAAQRAIGRSHARCREGGSAHIVSGQALRPVCALWFPADACRLRVTEDCQGVAIHVKACQNECTAFSNLARWWPRCADSHPITILALHQ